MNVDIAITRANLLLPGIPAPDGEIDPRWQAILAVGEYIETDPEAVWMFVRQWGCSPDEDLRAAIATCLLEHLLEHHFQLVFNRVAQTAREDSHFAETYLGSWDLGQTKSPENFARFDALREELSSSAG